MSQLRLSRRGERCPECCRLIEQRGSAEQLLVLN
jgi:hypothetical protein